MWLLLLLLWLPLLHVRAWPAGLATSRQALALTLMAPVLLAPVARAPEALLALTRLALLAQLVRVPWAPREKLEPLARALGA